MGTDDGDLSQCPQWVESGRSAAPEGFSKQLNEAACSEKREHSCGRPIGDGPVFPCPVDTKQHSKAPAIDAQVENVGEVGRQQCRTSKFDAQSRENKGKSKDDETSGVAAGQPSLL